MSLRLRDAEARFLKASDVCDYNGPTQEEWEELDAATAEYKAAEQAEEDEEEQERWTLLVYERRN